ncbi:phosphate ABC transporter substrate-binding protein [Antarctobacter heliothermus]|uniref:Phosphate ABC transporter substrate-binding protein n=1 Tax=Antarctobacter heliothermus TaxID=74033 RepID=A0A222E9L9_9RHOB|nr:PhnD/SsuA/transferrin family substrate-binding protein [Antarctobacter heliothermus]ASP22905.1 phosphate ABC transporter substrate-binding protein [Antarctobacter heliothermus]
MIASLPMYWQPEMAHHWDLFWNAVQQRLPDLPPLTTPDALPDDWYVHWMAPELILSHTCGLPFRDRLRDRVTYVASFDYALPDTPPGFYHSVVLARRGETRDQGDMRLAYNQPDSQSGWGSTRGRPFASYLETGSHRASVSAVIEGRADVAYVDAVTWRILCLLDPTVAEALEVIDRSIPTAGLALITAIGNDPLPLRPALAEALETLPDESRAAMGGPVGITLLQNDDYLAVPIPTAPPQSRDVA